MKPIWKKIVQAEPGQVKSRISVLGDARKPQSALSIRAYHRADPAIFDSSS